MKVAFDLSGLDRKMSKAGRAIERGTVNGINFVAFDAMRRERSIFPKVIDRPTKFTEKAPQVEKAMPGKVFAFVKIEEKRAKFLAPMEEGGTVHRDETGDMRGSGKSAIVIPVQADVINSFGSAGKNAVKKALKLPRTFYAMMPNQSVGGIFQRIGKARLPIRPLLIFREQVDYQPTLKFKERVEAYAEKRIKKSIDKQVDYQLRKDIG